MGQLDIIHNSYIFKSLSMSELEEILCIHSTCIESFPKNTVIVNEKSKDSRLGIIVKGKASVNKSNISGRNTSFNILSESDMFGMVTLFSDCTFNNIIKALTDVRVLFINEDVLKEIMVKYPSVGFSYIELLTQKINFLSNRIDTYLSDEKSDGLYDYLLTLSKKNNSKVIKLDISYTKLANMLHMSRSSLYRSLDELVENGIIKKENNTIEILRED